MARRRDSCAAILKRKFGPSKIEFKEAQKDLCPLCGRGLGNLEKCSYDHVHAHSKGHKVAGNVLLVHGKCNNKKRDDDPHPIYVEILHLVNSKLGWNGSKYTNCKNYIMRQRLMHICGVYQDFGIPMYIRDGKRLHIKKNPYDMNRIIEHASEWFVGLDYAQGPQPDEYAALVHRTLR